MRLEMLLTTLAALLATALNPPPSPAPPPPPTPVATTWPVGARAGERPAVVRAWDPPSTAYGAGHRGVDLSAPPGSPVLAVAPGRVSFAGRVAGRGVVSVELDGSGDPPLRTTYEPVRATLKKGTRVSAGEQVGTLEAPTGHCPEAPGIPDDPEACLHWGLRRAGTYLDPLTLLPPWLLRPGPSRLLPLTAPPTP
ncbi:M23 family metallopeptidase [Streptomyces sp. NRRL S-920]|uniref:M23 family metallopeptidase n=1 Tax=Streptomyces sp. NRRL S-920 TaxID=1463921 RepID=UPI0006924ADA|nr:M23 family metallopeptidase [Streptomyces sp. NRRL S-920]